MMKLIKYIFKTSYSTISFLLNIFSYLTIRMWRFWQIDKWRIDSLTGGIGIWSLCFGAMLIDRNSRDSAILVPVYYTIAIIFTILMFTIDYKEYGDCDRIFRDLPTSVQTVIIIAWLFWGTLPIILLLMFADVI